MGAAAGVCGSSQAKALEEPYGSLLARLSASEATGILDLAALDALARAVEAESPARKDAVGALQQLWQRARKDAASPVESRPGALDVFDLASAAVVLAPPPAPAVSSASSPMSPSDDDDDDDDEPSATRAAAKAAPSRAAAKRDGGGPSPLAAAAPGFVEALLACARPAPKPKPKAKPKSSDASTPGTSAPAGDPLPLGTLTLLESLALWCEALPLTNKKAKGLAEKARARLAAADIPTGHSEKPSDEVARASSRTAEEWLQILQASHKEARDVAAVLRAALADGRLVDLLTLLAQRAAAARSAAGGASSASGGPPATAAAAAPSPASPSMVAALLWTLGGDALVATTAAVRDVVDRLAPKLAQPLAKQAAADVGKTAEELAKALLEAVQRVAQAEPSAWSALFRKAVTLFATDGVDPKTTLENVSSKSLLRRKRAEAGEDSSGSDDDKPSPGLPALPVGEANAFILVRGLLLASLPAKSRLSADWSDHVLPLVLRALTDDAAADAALKEDVVGQLTRIGQKLRPQAKILVKELGRGKLTASDAETGKLRSAAFLRRQGRRDFRRLGLDSRAKAAEAPAEAEARDMPVLPEKPKEKLLAIFNLCDANGDGRINKRELIKACRSDPAIAEFFGLPAQIRQEDGSRDLLEALFQIVDDSEDRVVSWEEFYRHFKHRVAQDGQVSASTLSKRSGAAAAAAPQHGGEVAALLAEDEDDEEEEVRAPRRSRGGHSNRPVALALEDEEEPSHDDAQAREGARLPAGAFERDVADGAAYDGEEQQQEEARQQEEKASEFLSYLYDEVEASSRSGAVTRTSLFRFLRAAAVFEQCFELPEDFFDDALDEEEEDPAALEADAAHGYIERDDFICHMLELRPCGMLEGVVLLGVPEMLRSPRHDGAPAESADDRGSRCTSSFPRLIESSGSEGNGVGMQQALELTPGTERGGDAGWAAPSPSDVNASCCGASGAVGSGANNVSRITAASPGQSSVSSHRDSMQQEKTFEVLQALSEDAEFTDESTFPTASVIVQDAAAVPARGPAPAPPPNPLTIPVEEPSASSLRDASAQSPGPSAPLVPALQLSGNDAGAMPQLLPPDNTMSATESVEIPTPSQPPAPEVNDSKTLRLDATPEVASLEASSAVAAAADRSAAAESSVAAAAPRAQTPEMSSTHSGADAEPADAPGAPAPVVADATPAPDAKPAVLAPNAQADCSTAGAAADAASAPHSASELRGSAAAALGSGGNEGSINAPARQAEAAGSAGEATTAEGSKLQWLVEEVCRLRDRTSTLELENSQLIEHITLLSGPGVATPVGAGDFDRTLGPGDWPQGPALNGLAGFAGLPPAGVHGCPARNWLPGEPPLGSAGFPPAYSGAPGAWGQYPYGHGMGPGRCDFGGMPRGHSVPGYGHGLGRDFDLDVDGFPYAAGGGVSAGWPAPPMQPPMHPPPNACGPPAASAPAAQPTGQQHPNGLFGAPLVSISFGQQGESAPLQAQQQLLLQQQQQELRLLQEQQRMRRGAGVEDLEHMQSRGYGWPGARCPPGMASAPASARRDAVDRAWCALQQVRLDAWRDGLVPDSLMAEASHLQSGAGAEASAAAATTQPLATSANHAALPAPTSAVSDEFGREIKELTRELRSAGRLLTSELRSTCGAFQDMQRAFRQRPMPRSPPRLPDELDFSGAGTSSAPLALTAPPVWEFAEPLGGEASATQPRGYHGGGGAAVHGRDFVGGCAAAGDWGFSGRCGGGAAVAVRGAMGSPGTHAGSPALARPMGAAVRGGGGARRASQPTQSLQSSRRAAMESQLGALDARLSKLDERFQKLAAMT
eukprot:TRINITY_DN8698_c0_g1_i1.p1 TRINITY_DN8698_c0_g1~~TRINITY_DN8698_c0_g1_i1.p1  ORF type:complete len:1814 (-),score=508.32 TRINITY_DN8698_c0_g1_i1:55-5496(-)